MTLGYISKRLFHLALIMFGVSVVVFLMLRMIPGDPAQLLLGEFASPEELARLREQLGLNQSLFTQFWIYLSHIIQGDMGHSIRTNAPVTKEIWVRLIATLELSLAAMSIATVFGIAAGVLSAVKQYSLWDYGAMFMALVGVSMPIFWLGLMLIYLFAVKYPVLPMMGRISLGLEVPDVTGLMVVDAVLAGNWQAFVSALKHLLLPAFTLATIPMAIVARITRSAMLEVLNMDYVRTARAKGMTECDGARAEPGAAAGRGRAHGNHFQLARAGTLRGGFPFRQGLCRRPGMHPGIRPAHGGHQPVCGPDLRVTGPEDTRQ
jgi:peptide/nickel transport system permease protein